MIQKWLKQRKKRSSSEMGRSKESKLTEQETENNNMNIVKTSKIALRALNRNKMRSFLTALGIIIGVGAVIAMVSIGQGARMEVEERFESMGTNLLTVRPGSRSYRGRSGGGGTYTNLKEADALAILDNCDAVQYVSPSVNGRAQIVYQNKNWNTSIYGVGENYPEIRNWPVEQGTFFSSSQVRSGQKVAVLGTEVSQNLFEGADPIGQVIRINKNPFRVLGVLESKGESGGWMNRDDMIAVPYTTAQKRLLGIDNVQSIDVSAVSADRTNEARAQIEELLRIRHKLAPGAEDDFNVRDMADIAESASEATQILTILLGGIASISLLVGGIGIMNIMLVSVTERIREIGIRMSVGAKEKDILLQFLTEAIVLSVLGGFLGVVLGVGSSRLISHFAGMKTLVSFGAIVLAFVFSGSVGIFFGFYPARKASKLDPIEALRYE
jgi:putative ABC transport system permease protein